MEFDTPPKDPTGAGATQLAVGDRDGKVVLQFPTPVQWIALDAQTAAQAASSMLDAAVALGAQVTVQAPRVQVPKELRTRMTARALMVLRNKRAAAERDDVLAVRLGDTLLNMLDL